VVVVVVVVARNLVTKNAEGRITDNKLFSFMRYYMYDI